MAMGDIDLPYSQQTTQRDTPMQPTSSGVFGTIVRGFLKNLPVVGGIADVGMSVIDKIRADKANKENLARQKEQQAWERQAQLRTWEREDTAVQRRVADLRKAGLSPTLAAGSAASVSSPIRGESPKLDYTPSRSQMVMEAIKAKADVSRTLMENEYVAQQLQRSKAETWRMNWDNQWLQKNNQPSFTSSMYKDISSVLSQLLPGVHLPNLMKIQIDMPEFKALEKHRQQMKKYDDDWDKKFPSSPTTKKTNKQRQEYQKKNYLFTPDY